MVNACIRYLPAKSRNSPKRSHCIGTSDYHSTLGSSLDSTAAVPVLRPKRQPGDLCSSNNTLGAFRSVSFAREGFPSSTGTPRLDVLSKIWDPRQIYFQGRSRHGLLFLCLFLGLLSAGSAENEEAMRSRDSDYYSNWLGKGC